MDNINVTMSGKTYRAVIPDIRDDVAIYSEASKVANKWVLRFQEIVLSNKNTIRNNLRIEFNG